jgi:hypothetical protein
VNLMDGIEDVLHGCWCASRMHTIFFFWQQGREAVVAGCLVVRPHGCPSTGADHLCLTGGCIAVVEYWRWAARARTHRICRNYRPRKLNEPSSGMLQILTDW